MDQPRRVTHSASDKSQRAEDEGRSYYERIGQARTVTDPDEERILVRLWQRLRDTRARDLVVQSHLRFVVKQAHKKTKDRGALQDYIAAGNLGLLKAIQPGHFNPDRKPYIRFLTYAGSWVYKEMMDQDYASSSMIHVPTFRQKEQRKRARALRVAETTYGVESQEAKDVGYVSYVERVLSFDEVHDHELAADTGTISAYHGKQLSGLLEDALTKLPSREATIIRLHFGVRYEPRNLDQIGKIMSLTAERVRQLKEDALRMIRRHLIDKNLHLELENVNALEPSLEPPPEPPRHTLPEPAPAL